MASEMELSKHRLFDKAQLDAKDIKLFPGSNREATPEEMAQQVNRAIAQIASGDYEVVELKG